MDVKDKEITAMSSIAEALDKFDESDAATVGRIIRWASERYHVKNTGQHDVYSEQSGRTGGDVGEAGLETVGDLFQATNPKTDPEKALVVGYWIIIGEQKKEFAGQEVNRYLKNLGHGIGNITDAFTSLNSRKPALAMQTSKSGKSKQARKKYKLTGAGITEVRRMLGESNVGAR